MGLEILLTAKGMMYIELLIGNLTRVLMDKAQDIMTEDELDAAIAVEEARKGKLDARREDH